MEIGVLPRQLGQDFIDTLVVSARSVGDDVVRFRIHTQTHVGLTRKRGLQDIHGRGRIRTKNHMGIEIRSLDRCRCRT